MKYWEIIFDKIMTSSWKDRFSFFGFVFVVIFGLGVLRFIGGLFFASGVQECSYIQPLKNTNTGVLRYKIESRVDFRIDQTIAVFDTQDEAFVYLRENTIPCESYKSLGENL